MKTTVLQTKISLALIAVLLSLSTLSAKDVFIKPNAATANTGADWETATNVSYLGGSSIADGDVIHLAAGEYLRTTQLSISKYVTLLGGYAATSTGVDLSLRDIAAHKTIFKPDAGSATRGFAINATTASYGNTITLDGLILDGFAMATASGGTALGITTSQGDILIKNCTFSNNISLNANGGAVSMSSFAYIITTTFENCTFNDNQANFTTANGYGGAFFCNNGTTAKTFNFTNCTFKNNSAYGRAGALYFTSVITCNISDCLFDTNYSSNTTDNYGSGSGGCIYVAGGTQSNYIDIKRSIFVNSSNTTKGSVFWFNTLPKNYLTMTDCSLIGNYAKRLGTARAAIDCDSYANLDVVLNNCVLSNYNNTSAGVKQSKYADIMNLKPADSSTSSTFTNSILNGTYFNNVRNNTYDAVQPDTLYNKLHAYLADSTVALALSGDLKITDKIVFKKTFTDANIGTYIHAQVFDVKAKMGFPMTLVATIPAGHTLTVDGVDYGAGVRTINIAAAATDPAVSLKLGGTGLSRLAIPTAKVYAKNGTVNVSNIEVGNKLTAYNAAGQLLYNEVVKSSETNFSANGFVLVKISSATNYQVLKVISK